MHHLGRRSVLQLLGVAGGSGLLHAMCGRLAEAQAATSRRLIVVTGGNGWCNQGQQRNQTLKTTVRSETDFDLPPVLSALAAHKSKLILAMPFDNPHGVNQHGNSWSTLSAVPMEGEGPGGISIDRYIGKQIGAADTFSSVVLGLSEFGDLEKPAVHTSADGPGQPVSAFNTPVRAYAGIIGDRAPTPQPGQSTADLFARDRSVLDAMCGDITRVQRRLVGFEKQKLDQMLESCRELERQLAKRSEAGGSSLTPVPPALELDRTGLDEAVITGQLDVAVQALALGLTHVAHVSIMGRDAYNDAWKFLGIGADTHEGIMHGEAQTWEPPAGATFTNKFDWAVDEITRYTAGRLAYLYEKLEAIPEADGTLADSSLVLYLNSGGGKHHNGNNEHAVLLLGDCGGALRTGRYVVPTERRAINDVFVSVAQAMGVATETFGDPAICKGGVL